MTLNPSSVNVMMGTSWSLNQTGTLSKSSLDTFTIEDHLRRINGTLRSNHGQFSSIASTPVMEMNLEKKMPFKSIKVRTSLNLLHATLFPGKTHKLNSQFYGYDKPSSAIKTCTLTKNELSQLVLNYDIPQNVEVMLPKRNQTIVDAPLDYVGLYTYLFTLSNLRIPLLKFFCEVLNYFKVHISRFIPFKLAKLMTFAVMCKAYGGEPSIDLLWAFLNLGPAGNWLTFSNMIDLSVPKAVIKPITYIKCWKGSFFFIENKIVHSEYPKLLLEDNKLNEKSFKDMDFKIFMMKEVDSEFYFSREGGVGDEEGSSPYTMFVNNKTLVIDAEPLTSVPPFLKEGKRKQTAESLGRKTRQKSRKVPPRLTKLLITCFYTSDPLDVDHDPDIHAKELKDSADCHWVVAHVTPPLWKQHLKEISLEKLCDIHDKAYMRQVVLHNMMNRRTRELMSTMTKTRATCDAIQEREREKDKAYTELEVKCNDALHDLDKNPLVMNMRAEVETLQGVTVVAKVVPHVATELVHSYEKGLLIARLVKTTHVHGRCTTFEEVADLKEPFRA
ncbi:hypothetical protein Tco_0902895 [Tanacetum coccineum]